MGENEESGGFKFAVTLLATFGTILYAAYAYFQKVAVSVYFYAFASGVFTVLIISSIILILYVLIKGIALEVQDDILRNTLEHYALDIYLVAFFTFIITLTFIASAFILLYTEGVLIISFLITAIIFIIAIFLARPYLNKRFQRMGFYWAFISGFIIFLFALLPWVPLFNFVLNSPLQGDIEVAMESIYYNNGAPIPVFIQVTGPNAGLSIYLSKETSERRMNRIDSIGYLEPNHNPDDRVSNEHSNLTGNSLANGKYNVFINTSNLSAGYYELMAVRYKYEKRDVKGFYLLNASKR